MEKNLTFSERFYAKVEKTKYCWNWNSAIGNNGYGVFWVGGKKRSDYAHRVSYKMHKGNIPNGMVVMHSCDNPKCVNPNHLFIGTGKDNQQDALKKGRKAVGNRNPGRLALSDISAQRIMIVNGALSSCKLAKIYGVWPTTIRAVWSGKIWKNVAAKRRQALS